MFSAGHSPHTLREDDGLCARPPATLAKPDFGASGVGREGGRSSGAGNGCHAPIMKPVSSSLSSLYGCIACSGRSTEGGPEEDGLVVLYGGEGRDSARVEGCRSVGR